jgi:hypothetical protein
VLGHVRQPPGFERVEILARSLFRHRPVERRHVAAAVTVAPINHPMAAALAIRMDEYLTRPPIVARAVRVVETLALCPHPRDAGRVKRVREIGGLHFLERSRLGGGLLRAALLHPGVTWGPWGS